MVMNHEQPKLHQQPNFEEGTNRYSSNAGISAPDDVSGITNQPLNPDMRYQESFTREEANMASGIPEKHPGHKKAYIGLGLAGVTAAALIGGGVVAKKTLDSWSDTTLVDAATGERINQSPSEMQNPIDNPASYENRGTLVDIDLSTDNAAFKEAPLTEQLAEVLPYVNDRLNLAFAKYKQELEDINGYPIEGDLEAVAVNNSGQAIVNRDLTISWMSRNADDVTLGKNILASSLDLESENYYDEAAKAGQASSLPPAPMYVRGETETFYQGSFAGVEANNLPTKVVRVAIPSTGEVFELVYQLEQAKDDPSLQSWVNRKTISPDNKSAYVEDLTTWTPATP